MSDEAQPPQSQSRLLGLPAELREQVWRLVVAPEANRVRGADGYDAYAYGRALALLRVSRQVCGEARAAFRALNVFVRITTPWSEATDHVQFEGHVPILLRGRRAARFSHHALAVLVDAPLTGGESRDNDNDAGDRENDDDGDGHHDDGSQGGRDANRHEGRYAHSARAKHFVILLDDLPLFTRTWFYSDLSNPGLNKYLGASLHVRDPYTPAWDDGAKHVSPALQRRLLLPFGEVKNLQRLIVTGDPPPLPSVVAELRAAQAVPVRSPECCLDEASRFKAEGNALLAPKAGEDGRRADDEGDPRGALEAYGRAWEAMHIVVRGRWRQVHAEAFFARQLRGPGEGPAGEAGSGIWKGRNGALERLMLRVQLVANTCLAYLKLRLWREVVFWGMRSVGMMRQARAPNPGPFVPHVLGTHNGDEDVESLFYEVDVPPEQEAVLTFPAAVQMGKIYYRTAVAYKELGDKDKARKLLRVATIYLPHDNSVKKELAACALRLG